MKIGMVFLSFVYGLTSYGQFNPQKVSLPTPQYYELVGVSGRTEKFEADNRTMEILWNTKDKLVTIVQKAVSSYNNHQYVVFDNYYFDDSNAVIKNEAVVRTVFVSGERELRWRWTKAIRLSNENILVAVRIEALYGEYLNRFLLFDKSGTKLDAKQDYYLPGIVDLVPKENGEFLIITEKTFMPVYLPNYSVLEHDRISQYQDMFIRAHSSTSLLHFSTSGKLHSKHDYNVHIDSNIEPDIYMDILQHGNHYYVLVKSYLAGTLNVPTITVLKIDKTNAKLLSNKVIQEANIYTTKSFLKLVGNKLHVELTNGYVTESLAISD